DAHVRGLDRVLALLDMTAGPGPAGAAQVPAGTAPAHLGRFLWLRAAGEGWWEPAVRPGEWVTKGQVLGAVSSLDGAAGLPSRAASAPGVPVFLTSSPAVAPDRLLLCLCARQPP